jgi:hypothetical protein
VFVVGLVHDSGWKAPDPTPRRRPRSWHRAWRPLAWLAAWLWLLVLAGVLADAFGGLAGYVTVLLAVTLGCWRVDRWCARQYWHGLREWHG